MEMGRIKGLDEGRIEGRREDILEVLIVRFNKIPSEALSMLAQLKDGRVAREVFRASLLAGSIPVFIERLRELMS